jgi:hypothetical protein
MDRKQVIEELKALLQGFEDEYKAVPICLIEAINNTKEGHLTFFFIDKK